ncbi:MAG: mechanosensitive ion channel domain-containing protein [Desulforhopalus sp.]
MKLSGYIRSLMLFLIVAVGIQHSVVMAEETQGDGEVEAVSLEEQKTTLIQIYSWATILPKELIDLQNSLTKEKNLETVEAELAILTQNAAELKTETAVAGQNSDLQLMQVTTYQTKVFKITSRLQKLSESITSVITDLSAKRKEWQTKKEQISGYDKKELLTLALAKDQQELLIETVDRALQFIEEQLKQVLAVGKKIGDLQIFLYSVNTELQAMDAKLRATSIQQTSPSILSGKFYSRINANLFRQSYANTRQFIADQLKSLQNNLNLVLLCLSAFLLVCFGMSKTKDLVSSSSRWYPFAIHPLATTVFMASSLNAFIDMMPVNFDLPQQWEALLHILTMIAAIRLITLLIENKLRRRLIKRLIIFMAVAMIMVVLDLPQMVILLYVFYVSLLALVYYFYQLPSTRGKTDAKAWFRRIMGIFPGAVLLAGIAGYDQFAVILFSTLLSAIIACLIIWILFLLHFGFIDLTLSVLPLTSIRENREIVLKSIRPVITWLHVLLLIAIQGVVWGFFPTINEAFTGIFNLGFNFLNIHISPGFFLTVIFVVYGAILASKAVQTLLLKKILPRYGAAKGVQLSITRLAHYAILTIGFLIMLRVLGFQLNQLALLGGALGVGIGFGLQAIVNNFASGLILLFERPIKVGDTIQLGSDIGEVKHLGLRATIIQTFDNAEIVVPNSDLITGQVTNWTLGERRVRIRIPVGVAYGTDVEQVLNILLSCAKANPVVLSSPKPIALFLAFGNSSLDFELRVWISEFLDKMQVLSELNQDIENEFAIQNIEIPFPQTDLHLRSVDETAAARMHGTSPFKQQGLAEPAGADGEKER